MVSWFFKLKTGKSGEKGILYTGLRTKKELVNYALRELIQRKERSAGNAVSAMENDLYLLHQDSDFDRIASGCPLKIYAKVI
jgi:hypothetical protein